MGDTTINSVDRTLLLIDLLYKNGEEMGVSEIAKEMNQYKSTIHRTLTTLETHGFVVQNHKTQKYSLGPKLFAIAVAADKQFILRETVQPFAQALLNTFQESVNVAIVDTSSKEFSFFIIHHVEGHDKILRFNQVAQTNRKCHCSSLGKTLLAFTPNYAEYLNALELSYHTQNTITDKNAFQKHLEKVKELGYALDDEELEIGLTCVGVPVLDRSGKVILAISISGPTSRVKHNIETIVHELKKTAKELTQKLS